MEKQKFTGVQDTLFIPLAARVAVSQRFPEYFYDPAAMKFEHMDQVRAINAKSSEYSAMASVSRYYNMDRFVRAFLDAHPNGAIVMLGAGLETMNARISRPDVTFYPIDFPDVIALRTRLLGTAENEVPLSYDITDLGWTEQMDPHQPVMLIASGVFQYFKPEAVSDLIQKLKGIFTHAELVFDATDAVGIHYAQRYVKKSGNPDAMMYFFIQDAEQFAEENGVRLLEVRGFYKEARAMLGKKLNLYTRIAMKVADDKKRTQLLHLSLS